MVNNKKKRNRKNKEKKNELNVALSANANLSLTADRPNDNKDNNNDDDDDSSVCLHGSSADKMSNSEYLGTLEDFQILSNSVFSKQRKDLTNEFFNKHFRTVIDPGFARFVIARATKEYLDKGLKDKRTKSVILDLLYFGIQIRYCFVPTLLKMDMSRGSELDEKFKKYFRGLGTDRGIINCLARETPCNCMNEAKKESCVDEKTWRLRLLRERVSKKRNVLLHLQIVHLLQQGLSAEGLARAQIVLPQRCKNGKCE